MSKLPPAKKIKTRKASASGAKGGPSTGRGLNYQIDYAIQETLDYMSRALCAPHRVWEVKIEPRVSGSGKLTAWDLGFDRGNALFEIKLKPTRADIQEWIERVVTSATLAQKFHLVYSKGAGLHLSILDRLIRIAAEATGEADFRSKLKAEGVPDNDPYLFILGNNAYDLLSRMTAEQVPEYLLKSSLEFRARQLAGEVGGRQLRQFLFQKFHEAVPHRTTFSVNELSDEARELGIQFQTPAAIDTRDISPTATSALVILQACKYGLPTEVLAATLGSSGKDIEGELHDLKNSHVLTVENDLWSMKPLPTVISSSNTQSILADSLSSLLTFVENSPTNANIGAHVGNVISLAKIVRQSHPNLVAIVFTRLDKRLKQIGNKRLVWFVANLSIQAAQTIRNRDRDVVEAEARALICGTSWAFQRLHKVPEARIDAEAAYALSCDVRLDRTLAFCVKCRGRLSRMEAEATTNGEERISKLQESADLLNEAILSFGALAQFGPDDPEVGDCYSLLGRTYLESLEMRKAWDSIERAYELIVDETSKDYIDLVILTGDIEVASGSRDAARRSYDRALEISAGSDPEVSEMRARAYYQSGLNEQALGNLDGARSRYESARQIWDSLEDEKFAAKAAWANISLDETLSKDTTALLVRDVEDLRVRVEVVNMHKESLQQSRPTIARRSAPPANYWRQLIARAKERVASRGQRSETQW